MVHFYLSTMNIHGAASYEDIMLAPINGLVKDQKAKGKDYGVWSNQCVLDRIHTNTLMVNDFNICKGIYLPYGRMLGLYAKVQYNNDLQNVLDEEKNTIGDDVDAVNGLVSQINQRRRDL